MLDVFSRRCVGLQLASHMRTDLVLAGGAPLWISSCDYAPGCAGAVQVDSHAMNVNDHMRAVPADGTLIANHRDGGFKTELMRDARVWQTRTQLELAVVEWVG